MSYAYGDGNSDVVDQSAVKSRVPGVLGSIQLHQVAGITGEMLRMMKTAVSDTSSNVATNIKQQIEELKRQKARKKSAFTKARRAMLILLDEDLPSRSEIRSQQQKVEDCQEKAMSVMETLIDMYTAIGDQESSKRSMKNWKHWRGSAHQHKTEHKNIWTAELMKNQVHCLASHQESLQEEV